MNEASEQLAVLTAQQERHMEASAGRTHVDPTKPLITGDPEFDNIGLEDPAEKADQ